VECGVLGTRTEIGGKRLKVWGGGEKLLGQNSRLLKRCFVVRVR
jgi:hypothetical protein